MNLLFRMSLLPPLSLCMCLCLSGCDALRSIAEGESEEEHVEGVAGSHPSPPPEVGRPLEAGGAPQQPAPEMPSTAAVQTPEEFLEEFLAKSPRQRTDADLDRLTRAPELLRGLTELDLRGGGISDNGLTHLARFPDLERLDISETNVSSIGLARLTACSKLTSLALDHLSRVDEVGVRDLTPLPLTEISLQHTAITDDIFLVLRSFKDLEVMRLDGNTSLTGANLRASLQSGEFKNLRIVTASGTQLGYYGMEEIGRLRGLQVLLAAHAAVRDTALDEIQKCTDLVELDLSGNAITLLSTPRLPRLRNLERLRLRGCQGLTDEAIRPLGAMNHLTLLDLHGTRCSPEAIAALRQRLPNTEVLYEQ